MLTDTVTLTKSMSNQSVSHVKKIYSEHPIENISENIVKKCYKKIKFGKKLIEHTEINTKDYEIEEKRWKIGMTHSKSIGTTRIDSISAK